MAKYPNLSGEKQIYNRHESPQGVGSIDDTDNPSYDDDEIETVSLSNYTIVSKIRKAIFGHIYLAIREKDEKKVVIKLLMSENVRNRVSCLSGEVVNEDALNEARMMNLVKKRGGHPNVVNMISCIQEKNHFGIVQEYCKLETCF